MTDDLTTSDIGNFGGKKFAGTVDVAPTSRLPGFGEQDIQILMSVG